MVLKLFITSNFVKHLQVTYSMYTMGRLYYRSLYSLLVHVLEGLPSRSFFKFILILVFPSEASPLKPIVYSERRWVSRDPKQ